MNLDQLIKSLEKLRDEYGGETMLLWANFDGPQDRYFGQPDFDDVDDGRAGWLFIPVNEISVE